MKIKELGGDSYRARGCGYSTVYDCHSSSTLQGTTTDYTCVPEKDN